MPNPVNRDASRPLPAPDMGDDRGFGGFSGANRHVPPFDHSKVETLPVATPADYGPAPGGDPNFGSKGVDGVPVSKTTKE